VCLIFRFSAVHKVQFILCQEKITGEYKAVIYWQQHLNAYMTCPRHECTKKKLVHGMPGQWGWLYLGESDSQQWSTNPFMHIIHTSTHPTYVKLLPKTSKIHTLSMVFTVMTKLIVSCRIHSNGYLSTYKIPMPSSNIWLVIGTESKFHVPWVIPRRWRQNVPLRHRNYLADYTVSYSSTQRQLHLKLLRATSIHVTN
jgi:hypothetical protein